MGYYRQDFSTLNFEDTVYNALLSVMEKPDEEKLRSTAAGFLITSELMHAKIGSLGGAKGLGGVRATRTAETGPPLS